MSILLYPLAQGFISTWPHDHQGFGELRVLLTFTSESKGKIFSWNDSNSSLYLSKSRKSSWSWVSLRAICPATSAAVRMRGYNLSVFIFRLAKVSWVVPKKEYSSPSCKKGGIEVKPRMLFQLDFFHPPPQVTTSQVTCYFHHIPSPCAAKEQRLKWQNFKAQGREWSSCLSSLTASSDQQDVLLVI